MICAENKLSKTIRMAQNSSRYFRLGDVGGYHRFIYWYDDDLGTYVLPMIAPTLLMIWSPETLGYEDLYES